MGKVPGKESEIYFRSTKYILATLFICTLFLFSACSLSTGGEEEEAPRATAVETVAVERGDIDVTVELTGTVQAESQVGVTPLHAARVVEVYVKEGDRVEKGDSLFRLDDRDLKYALNQEEKGREQARGGRRLAEERAKQADSGVNEARLALESAQNELKRAQLGLQQGEKGHLDADELTKLALERAERQWDEARRMLERMEVLYEEGAVSRQEYEQAIEAEAQARLAYEQAEIDAKRATPPEEKEMLEVAVSQAELGVKQAELAVVSAEASRRLARLDVEQARISEEQAALNVERARQNLDEAVVTAPISGEVVGFNVEVGELVTNQQPALMIVTPEQLNVAVPVTADRLPLFQIGNKVDVSIPSWGGKVKAEVSSVARAANEAGLFMVEARLLLDEVEGAEDLIRPGMVAKIHLNETLVQDKWIIPSQAVIESASEAYVYVVDTDRAPDQGVEADGIARRVEVEVIRMETELAAVEGDFSAGEQVIIRGQHLLTDGDPLRLVGGDAS